MADEGFHEIQLNGKQLVFLFMAAIVASVVVFLCGVMVGRGVRQPQAVLAAGSSEAPVDPTASIQSASSAAPITAERVPVSAQESLTYAERLEAPVPPQETLKEPAAPVAAPPAEPAPAPADGAGARERAAEPPVSTASLTEPTGDGFVVQVGAYPSNTADVIARGLSAKGFPSFITPRDRGLFAVRVGKYKDRREAEAVARRLAQDEQFNNPWVTR